MRRYVVVPPLLRARSGVGQASAIVLCMRHFRIYFQETIILRRFSITESLILLGLDTNVINYMNNFQYYNILKNGKDLIVK